jgi:ABC-2 type transport system ATP-binding protein
MTTNGASNMAVELTNVTKCFGRQVAVGDLSLRIKRGSTFGFLGPNGAGKTTTIRMLMGLLTRSAGQVSVLGIDPAVEPLIVKQRVGYVPEQQFIYRWMRVGEAISFCRSFYPTWNNGLAEKLLKFFNLDADKKVKHLSKGMLTKLSLLLAMSHEPELLILDEPMAGLDPIVREELLDSVLQTVCEREQTVVFSSHTLDDVQRMADVVAIINEGQLLVYCAIDDLLNRTKRMRAVLQDGAAPSHPPGGMIWQRVQNREWLLTVKDYSPGTVEQLKATNPLERVEVIDLTLEDIFKDYVRGRRVSA